MKVDILSVLGEVLQTKLAPLKIVVGLDVGEILAPRFVYPARAVVGSGFVLDEEFGGVF
jgi:hypothetical protein